jgi:hypothetical protein
MSLNISSNSPAEYTKSPSRGRTRTDKRRSRALRASQPAAKQQGQEGGGGGGGVSPRQSPPPGRFAPGGGGLPPADRTRTSDCSGGGGDAAEVQRAGGGGSGDRALPEHLVIAAGEGGVEPAQLYALGPGESGSNAALGVSRANLQEELMAWREKVAGAVFHLDGDLGSLLFHERSGLRAVAS